LTVANEPHPPAPDDMVTCLAKAAAGRDKPPVIVTFSRAPVKNLMSHVFGPDATANLIAISESAAEGGGQFRRADGVAGSPLDFDPAKYTLLPRFLDLATFELVARHFDTWLAGAAGVIVHFPLARMQRENLSEAGFRESRAFAPQERGATVFLRRPERLSPRRDGPVVVDRPAMRRLVIVDPCLGAAPGHYAHYADRLTQGARAIGAEVVWGCNGRLGDVGPVEVTVRRCFPRSFFDLTLDEVGTVDLSGELAEGWDALLAEFDSAETHFLMHSADAHQLRAAARLLDRPLEMRSAVHINFHSSPRRMPGRAAKGEVHAAVLRLRKAPQWERSLFFWAENRRVGRWMSEWLQTRVPILPFLSPSVSDAAVRERKPGSGLTLSILGESRPTKGFLDLPEIIDRIAAAPELRAAVKVVIQNWRPFRGDPEPHEQAIARLSVHPFVEIVEGVLESEDYARRLAEADVLLLPYQPGLYNLQGSGIVVEGFSTGAIILARAGTTIEDETAHGVVVTYGTLEELVEVLGRLVRNIDEISGNAKRMAVRFREANTPKRYVAALDARARGKA